MSNYSKVLRIAKDLREDFKDLTIHQSLEIATKIQQCDILSDGLLVQGSAPVALEAIAMILGYNPDDKGRTTIVDSIKDIGYNVGGKG